MVAFLANIINLLKPTVYVMHQQVEHSTILRSAHTVYLFMYLCGSESKQRLFPYTTLTDCFFITEI